MRIPTCNFQCGWCRRHAAWGCRILMVLMVELFLPRILVCGCGGARRDGILVALRAEYIWPPLVGLGSMGV
jgi:hypothetical protein